MLTTVLSILAALSAGASGGLWIKAASTEVPAPPETSGVGALLGGYLITLNRKKQRIDLHATYAEQSKWNSYAAYASALAAILAGFAAAAASTH